MATRNIVPRNDGEGNIGTQLKQWLKGYFWEIYTGGITNGINSISIENIIKGIGFNQRLNSNFTTTLNTAQNINLSFAMKVNEIYIVEVEITAQCSATGGIRYSIGAPVGATIEGWVHSSTSAITTLSYQRIIAINTNTSIALHTAANIPAPDRLRFAIVNGATAGDCIIRTCSVTNGQTTTIFAGSWLSAKKAIAV